MKRTRSGAPLIRYDFHLSASAPLTGDIRVDRPVDRHPWFDIHDDLEFGMVLKGGLRRFWGPFKRDLAPGEVWLHDAFEPHGYQIIRGPCDLVFLIFRRGLLADIRLPGRTPIDWLAPFQAPPVERARVPPARREAILELGRRFADAVHTRNETGNILVQLRLMEILLALMESTAADALPHHQRERDTDMLKAANQAMQSRRLITTERMADSLGLQIDQFSRRFEKEIGTSFTKFGLRCRLNGVAQDLSLTELPIKAIAADWDFAHESHLDRVFLRHFGCTPGVYRRRHKGSRHADGS
ncbi:MAG: helix-turn-helix transcriptional regulator [Lentisphaerae bacterium]|nr:helix-turn-helix transcriptional regulator [Lentisphaerota bacterium]